MPRKRRPGATRALLALLAALVWLPAACGAAKPAVPPSGADAWVRPADGMTMVRVPAGEFIMGTDAAGLAYAVELCRSHSPDPATAAAVCRRDAFTDEQPAHAVTLDAFWLDRTEVTNGQYRLCVAAGACAPPAEEGSYSRPGYYNDPAYSGYPVVWVSWRQAVDYCAWAGARLPTESQWEYAARGPASLTYPWGNDFDGARLNYCDVGCTAGPNDPSVSDGYPDTAPVGSFPAGASWAGALDLAGNVREWVADWYGRYPAASQANPAGPAAGESRIPRGGSWLDKPDDVRGANRGGNDPAYTRHKVGFRCAWAP